MKESYKPVHKKRLEEAVSHYDLCKDVFGMDVEKAVHHTDKLLQDRQVDRAFLEESEQGDCELISLAIGAAYGKAGTKKERSRLIYTLNTIAIGVKDDKLYSFSKKVRTAAEKGNEYAGYFHPVASDSVMNETEVTAHEALLGGSINHKQTLQVRAACSEWGEDTLLHNIRTELRVTPETETPYKLFVVENGIETVSPDAQGYTTFDDPRTIVLSNLLTPRGELAMLGFGAIEHEYGHVQGGDNLICGAGGLLFRGVTEGLTESKTTRPFAYNEQREVINLLEAVEPGVSSVSEDAHRGDMHIGPMSGSILKQCGSDIFLAYARMQDRDTQSNDPITDKITKKVLVHPDNIKDLVKKRYG